MSLVAFHLLAAPIPWGSLGSLLGIICLWSLVAALISLLLSTLGMTSEIVINQLMLVVTSATFFLVKFAVSPLSNGTAHAWVMSLVAVACLVVSLVFIHQRTPRIRHKKSELSV